MFIFDPPERSVSVNEQQPLKFTSNGEIVFLTGLQFTAGSLNIFGLDVTLTVNPISDGSDVAMEDVACAVVFVGRDSQSVVASNPVRWEFCESAKTIFIAQACTAECSCSILLCIG